MKAVRFHRYGPADQVAVLEDIPDAPPPGPGEVRVRMRAAPINPADLLLLEGKSGHRPALPFVPGAESAGEIELVGEGVNGLAPGDLVAVLPGSGNWQEAMTLRAAAVMKLPAGMPMELAAQIKANPATAAIMLSDIVTVPAGGWVVFNAGNSAVGQALAALAPDIGARTIAIVRRGGTEARGDAVIVDDGTGSLTERILAATGGVRPVLGIDAVGGAATDRMAACLAEGGTVVNYGLLSGEKCQIDAAQLVFRGIILRGFWLATWFPKADRARVRDLYAGLFAAAMAGRLHLPVEARYPLREIGAALRHAARDGRSGKILLTS